MSEKARLLKEISLNILLDYHKNWDIYNSDDVLKYNTEQPVVPSPSNSITPKKKKKKKSKSSSKDITQNLFYIFIYNYATPKEMGSEVIQKKEEREREEGGREGRSFL